MMLAVLRVIIWVVTGLLGALAIGIAAVFLVDTWRASGVHPGECDFLLQSARGDLRTDDDVLARAWEVLVDPEAETVGDLGGTRPVLGRSCLLYAGRSPAGDTVVYADTTVAGKQSLVRVAEVRLPREPGGTAQRAVASHSTLIGSELRAGVLLPLTGAYLAPGDAGEVTAVRVLSSADGYATGTDAVAIGEGLFAVGVAPDLSLAPDEQIPDVDAILMLQGSDLTPGAVALPAGSERDGSRPVRAAYTLSVDGAGTPDELTARRVGPVLSAMSADPRYSLVRDRAMRPPSLEARTGPALIVLAPIDPLAAIMPTFSVAAVGQQPI